MGTGYKFGPESGDRDHHTQTDYPKRTCYFLLGSEEQQKPRGSLVQEATTRFRNVPGPDGVSSAGAPLVLCNMDLKKPAWLLHPGVSGLARVQY